MQEDQVFLFSMIRMWLVISLMKHGQHLVNNKLWWQDSCSLFWFEFILLYKFPCSKNSVYDQISTTTCSTSMLLKHELISEKFDYAGFLIYSFFSDIFLR